jgi:hypothetical protein
VKKAVFVLLIALLLAFCINAAVAKGKEATGQMVDSGSFGVFQNGTRVATETFSVHQSSDASTVSSQIKQEGSTEASQTSEMQINPDGSLIRYEWQELQEPKAELTVMPNNEFLLERVTQGANSKPSEQPFLMPKTSVILDDNFSVQREVLAWRYLASSCTPEKTQMKCIAAPFGTIDPQERISVRVMVQPAGVDEVTIRGAKRQLWRLNLKSENEEWSVWLDPQDHYKMLRLTRTGVPMEVVRD